MRPQRTHEKVFLHAATQINIHTRTINRGKHLLPKYLPCAEIYSFVLHSHYNTLNHIFQYKVYWTVKTVVRAIRELP